MSNWLGLWFSREHLNSMDFWNCTSYAQQATYMPVKGVIGALTKMLSKKSKVSCTVQWFLSQMLDLEMNICLTFGIT